MRKLKKIAIEIMVKIRKEPTDPVFLKSSTIRCMKTPENTMAGDIIKT
jgi:hypothetical protein